MIYVMSDIHGQKRRFDSVMKQIKLQPDDTLYILGDVIDRNPDGIKILRQIMAMPNAKMLLGNHELMMMNALYYPPPEDEEWPEYYYGNTAQIAYRESHSKLVCRAASIIPSVRLAGRTNSGCQAGPVS